MFRLIILSLILLTINTSCIDSFTPKIEAGDSNKYVINGLLTDQAGYQNVTISLTSKLDNPQFIPLTDCNVQIISSDQKIFNFSEFEEGKYRVWLNSGDIQHGIAYSLSIATPAGIEIKSDFETMLNCPDIDSIYYKVEEKPTTDPSNPSKGIQFYIDVKGVNSDCRNFRWEIEETYEYHAPYPKIYYWDGEIEKISPPDYSTSVCWSTLPIKSIYTLSTKDNDDNVYKKHPLNFVDNQTPRLLYVYSLLVTQFGLNESAYSFWDQMRINSEERGGLYETQPLSIRGNLQNVTTHEQNVLGFFEVSSKKTKRIFISNVDGLENKYHYLCEPQVLINGFMEIEEREYPTYFIWINSAPATLQEGCVDCRVFGGTTVKPDFWPNIK